MMKIPLFDIDGTLTEISDEVNQVAYRYAFNTVYGIDAGKDDDGSGGEGRIQNQVFIQVLKYHGFSDNQIFPKLPEARKAHTVKFLEYGENFKFKILPGAKELLEAIKSTNDLIGVLTGNNKEVAQYKLEKVGLRKYIDFGAYGSEANIRWDLVEVARKRAEEILAKPVSKNKLVIIGDTPNDLKTAKETGIKSIIVTTGIHDEEKYKIDKPDLIVSSLEDKDKILDFLKN